MSPSYIHEQWSTYLQQDRPKFSYESFLVCGLVLVCIGRVQETVSFLMPLRIGLIFLLLAAVSAMNFANKGEFRVWRLEAVESRLLRWFAVVALASTVFSISHRESFNFMKSTFFQLLFVFFFVANVVRSRADIVRAIWAYLLGTLFLALPAISAQAANARWSSTDATYDANDLALLFNVAIALAICLIPCVKGWKRLVLLVAVPLYLYALVFTGSRGGLLGLASVSLLLLFKNRRIAFSKKILVLLLLLGLGYTFTPESSLQRFASIGQEDYNTTDDFGRVQIWKRNVELIGRHPLFGVGPGGFGNANGVTFASELGGMSWRMTAHNSFLLIGVELGLPGLVLFLLLLFKSLANMRSLQRKVKTALSAPEYTQLALGIEAALTAYIVCGFFLSVCYWLLPYFLVALGVCLQRSVSAAGQAAVEAPAWPHGQQEASATAVSATSDEVSQGA